jgi:serine/threonine protein kinase
MPPLKSIGKYEIVDALGTGGMGTVYRAFDPTLERIVALKLLHPEVVEVSPSELSERFRNEARAVARLNHPAIVAIFDYDDQDPAGAYIAMEYVNGCALDEYVRQHADLHIEDALSAMQQVLAGLDYAHQREIVHRDIKPSNLLVTREGVVKITDFGISKIGPRSKTQTGLLVGTPQYMAPEQYMGGPIDHRCDIHSAGVVLYELMTGAAPFSGSAAEIMHQVCYVSAPALSTVDPQIPSAFDAVVAKALEKKPENRYATASEFSEALRSIWQTISNKPASATLSPKARLVATTMRRVPVAERAAGGSTAPDARPAGGFTAPDAHPATAAINYAGPAPSIPPDSPTPKLTRPESGGAAPSVPPAWTPKLTRPESGGAPGTLAAWSKEQLAEIERQLTPIVGPMARVLVRSAASNTANRQQLYAMLANHLRTPEERRRFLAGEPTTGGGVGQHKEVGAGPSVTTPGLLGDRPLTPETLQRATQLLSRYIGPIASVVTKKAAQTAVDEAHLYQLLAGKLTDRAEQERFIREAEQPH